jgi:hypothetical protein
MSGSHLIERRGGGSTSTEKMMSGSPLAEKRMLISLLKGYLTGRRSYSDSIYIRKSRYNENALNSTSTSSTSTQCSPVADANLIVVREKVFSGIGC